MYFDAPFGFDLFPHDSQLTVNQLLGQSKQFDAINTSTAHSWIVIHKPEDCHIVLEAMRDRNYKNMQHAYWHKTDQYTEGPVNRLTNCVEMITIGFFPSSDAIHWNVSTNPRERTNLIDIPSVLTLAKDIGGNPINVTEKPPELIEWLLGMWCKKGANVLIVGTGAGGCLKGALRSGYNVVGVENDDLQYNQLFANMNQWISNFDKEKKLTKNKANPKQKAEVYTSPVKGKANAEENVPIGGLVIDVQKEGTCFSCEDAGSGVNPLEECSGCKKMNHVIHCMENVADEGEEKELICSGCKVSRFGV